MSTEEEKTKIKIYLFDQYLTDLYVSTSEFVVNNEEVSNLLNYKPKNSLMTVKPQIKYHFFGLTTNAYFFRPFFRVLSWSKVYRTNFINNLCICKKKHVGLKLQLKPPDKEIIDYSWNERMLREVWIRVEIENALSWLSTLGGAFSALGDYFQNCAEKAGEISIRQLKLSILLGDEGLAARSRLYSSLALAQMGKLKLARHIVRSVAEFAKKSKDKRLMRMCQGVWAKLRYLRILRDKDSGRESNNNKVVRYW